MATLATGLPATALTGLDLHQLDSYKEFHCLITDSPSPRFPSAISSWPIRVIKINKINTI
jgi:hypothetical protein